MRDYPEHEIEAAIAEKLSECATDEQRTLVLKLAAEAKARGHSWPMRPKFVPKPPLHNDEWCQ